MAATRTWAIVLAGGDGTRLGTLTRDLHGAKVPKQYCSLTGESTLLELALGRAERLVPSERILVAVTDAHRRWWSSDLGHLPPHNVVNQPRNRGTCAGLLLPLLEIVGRDPFATIIVLPSDHSTAEEVVLEAAAREAMRELSDEPEAVIVLGIEPERPDPDLGWIVPAELPIDGARPVASFVEKPDPRTASRLQDRGAVWNSFIVVARARRVVELFEAMTPHLLWALRLARWDGGGPPSRSLQEVYASLPTLDFSRHVLSRAPRALRVLTVPPCGWCDLGTPERVARWFREQGELVGAGRRRPVRAARRPVLAERAAASTGTDRGPERAADGA